MRIRAVHLASVLLLLASLGVAEGSSLRDARYVNGAQCIGILLDQDHASASPLARCDQSSGKAVLIDLPAAARARFRSAWTLRPPAAHSLAMHAFTGSSL